MTAFEWETSPFPFAETASQLAGTDETSLVSIAVSKALQSIANYCNISDIPEALYFTACEMAADALLYRKSLSGSGSDGGDGVPVGSVASISEDGRSVSFSNDRAAAENALLQGYMNDNVKRREELSRFKKVYRLG